MLSKLIAGLDHLLRLEQLLVDWNEHVGLPGKFRSIEGERSAIGQLKVDGPACVA